jgi:hypothetical protein
MAASTLAKSAIGGHGFGPQIVLEDQCEVGDPLDHYTGHAFVL